MRILKVYNNEVLAGTLAEVSPTEYVFRYEDDYFRNPLLSCISLTLPKSRQEYRDFHIFLFLQICCSKVAIVVCGAVVTKWMKMTFLVCL